MEAQDSFNLASQAVSDAVAFDNKHNYREARSLYLKAITLFEESMQGEANETKLNVLRNRIAAYKKRAAELEHFLRTQVDAQPIRADDLELEMGLTRKTIEASPATQKTDNRLERIVYGLAAVVVVLALAVIALFVQLQVYIMNSDNVTQSDLEVTNSQLNTVATAVLRLSTSPSEAEGSNDAILELEEMNDGTIMDYSGEIEEIKLALASLNLELDAKADLAAVYTSGVVDDLLQGKADAISTYTADEVDDIISTFSTDMDEMTVELRTISDGMHTLQGEMDLKADSANLHDKNEDVLSVLNVVELLSGVRLNVSVGESFFTEAAELQEDLYIPVEDFSEFQETIAGDIAEVRGNLEGLEQELQLKADSNTVPSRAEVEELSVEVTQLTGLLGSKADAQAVSTLAAEVTNVEEQVMDVATSLDTKLDEEDVVLLIDAAVDEIEPTDLTGLMESIEGALESIDDVENTLDTKVNTADYNVEINNLELLIGDAIPKCSWTNGEREVFADNEGCRDDLLLECAGGVLTKVRMRCGNGRMRRLAGKPLS